MDSLEEIIAKNEKPEKDFSKDYLGRKFLPDPFDPKNKNLFNNPNWVKEFNEQ